MAERNYQQALFVIDSVTENILCEEFTVTNELDAETRPCTSSIDPYDVDFGKRTLSWSLDSVAPKFRKDLEKVMEEQVTLGKLFNIQTYDFAEGTGDLVEDDVLYDAYITNIEKTSANKPFSVEGGALRIKRKS